MSTRYEAKLARIGERSVADSNWLRDRDAVEEVAFVASARRSLLLGVHRHRLRREDLEDCYSQATVELIAHVKAGRLFASRLHIRHALELRFVSRARDRHRALAGRSPKQAALGRAEALGAEDGGGVEPVDRGPAVEVRVLIREELRHIPRLVAQLSEDQRRILASQLQGEPCAQFCAREGWSREKYRKVAQRARARLRALLDEAAPSHR
ncbi:MAG TPA: hypothetical protein VL988_03550 [Solirubrobacteraceae bacterium]|nr:hypothetical protein [Solirubrobacteraceae bacterium]